MKAANSGTVRGRRVARGFTLVELAVMLLIVGLILGSMMFTFSAQVEMSNRAETLRRLENAKELLLAFAIVNGRLPCPATAASGGQEAPPGGGTCTSSYGGFLPAMTIGFQPQDSQFFAVDAWGNRIRYAVSATSWNSAAGRFTTQHVPPPNAAAWGMTTTPNDLIVCSLNQAIPPGTACAPGTAVTNTATVAAIVFSTGKNGILGPQGSNETENVDDDHVFVSRAPDPAGAAGGGGEFDDLLTWIPVGLLYGRLISAGVLP